MTKLRLSREERRAIFAGDHRALRRDRRPDVKAGSKLVLSWTRRSRHVVDRDTGAVIETPRKPTVWIEFREPELRDGQWVIRFIAHDERQPLRLLGASPSPRGAAGLKTRWKSPGDVPERDEHHEPWTPETERGYVGSARVAIDSAEAVDDEGLRIITARSRHNRAEFQRELEEEDAELAEEARRKRERALRDRLRTVLKGLGPEAQEALLARMEQELRKAEMDSADSARRVA